MEHVTITQPAGSAELDAALGVWQRANAARGKPPGPQRIARAEARLADPAALVMWRAATVPWWACAREAKRHKSA